MMAASRLRVAVVTVAAVVLGARLPRPCKIEQTQRATMRCWSSTAWCAKSFRAAGGTALMLSSRSRSSGPKQCVRRAPPASGDAGARGHGVRPHVEATRWLTRPPGLGQRRTTAARCRGGPFPGRAISGASFPRAPVERGLGRLGKPWFDLTSRELADAGAADPPPVYADKAPGPFGPNPIPGSDATRPGKMALSALGLTCEATTIQGKFVARVSSVEPGEPHSAGARARRHDHRLE